MMPEQLSDAMNYLDDKYLNECEKQRRNGPGCCALPQESLPVSVLLSPCFRFISPLRWKPSMACLF